MWKKDEVDPRLVALLDELKSTSERNPKAAARARAQFLAEVVSLRDQQRHSLWTIFQQKEKFAMQLIMSMLVIVGLIFGGSATVSAAQDDLPNEPLYRIKLMREDINLWLVSDPVAQIELLMKQAQTRTEEMATLVEDGIAPPATLEVRAQERIQHALQLASNLDDPTLTATLQRIHTQLQTQEQLMSQLQDGSCVECEPVLLQTRDMLRNQLRQIERGLNHPQTSPNQNQNQNQNQIRITQTPPAIGDTVIPQESCTPVQDGAGQQNGTGNLSAGTPMPHSNSPKQDGSGMQNGPDNGNSSQSGNDNGNGSGNGTGPGPGGQGGRP